MLLLSFMVEFELYSVGVSLIFTICFEKILSKSNSILLPLLLLLLLVVAAVLVLMVLMWKKMTFWEEQPPLDEHFLLLFPRQHWQWLFLFLFPSPPHRRIVCFAPAITKREKNQLQITTSSGRGKIRYNQPPIKLTLARIFLNPKEPMEG